MSREGFEYSFPKVQTLLDYAHLFIQLCGVMEDVMKLLKGSNDNASGPAW
jgi:hypothetical protein